MGGSKLTNVEDTKLGRPPTPGREKKMRTRLLKGEIKLVPSVETGSITVGYVHLLGTEPILFWFIIPLRRHMASVQNTLTAYHVSHGIRSEKSYELMYFFFH